MRLVSRSVCLGLVCGLLAWSVNAQPPREKASGARDAKAGSFVADSVVKRLMAFDKNKDGKLEREEITDARLLRLFDRADGDKDGVVTKAELTALAKGMADDEAANPGPRGGFGPPPGGPGGPGGFGGPGGPGGPPPAPGQILPPFLRDQLKLTDAQKKQLDDLQKEVDGKLAKILTEKQRNQMKSMPRFGRGGPGGPGGPGGRGPDGPPPPPPPDR